MRELFKNTPESLPGNDDLGAMSSWYLWAALGMYPLILGRAGFVLGSPLFPQVTLALGDRHIHITARGASQKTPYVQQLLIDGESYSRQWLPLSTLASANALVYTLAASPNRAWGSALSDAPPSLSAKDWKSDLPPLTD